MRTEQELTRDLQEIQKQIGGIGAQIAKYNLDIAELEQKQRDPSTGVDEIKKAFRRANELKAEIDELNAPLPALAKKRDMVNAQISDISFSRKVAEHNERQAELQGLIRNFNGVVDSANELLAKMRELAAFGNGGFNNKEMTIRDGKVSRRNPAIMKQVITIGDIPENITKIRGNLA